MLKILLTLIMLSCSCSSIAITKIDYIGFSLWIDCDQRGVVSFAYESKNAEELIVSKTIRKDTQVPKNCQQKTVADFNKKIAPRTFWDWDRGFLVEPDQLETEIDTNIVSNTVPIRSELNQPGGAWFEINRLTDCLSSSEKITVMGGVLWGNYSGNDFFTYSHGIRTPERFFKILYNASKNEVSAWLIPNNASSDKILDARQIDLKKLKEMADFWPDEFADAEKAKQIIMTCNNQITYN